MSEVSIDNLNNIHVILRLKKGRIFLKPEPVKKGELFAVVTSSAYITVTGTKFSVQADDEGNTSVSVNEGEVSLEPVLKNNLKSKLKESAYPITNEQLKPVMVVPGEKGEIKIADVRVLNQTIEKAIDNKTGIENIQIVPITKISVIDPDIKEKLDGLNSESIIKNTGNMSILNINSSPQGADVFVNQSYLGRTPLQYFCEKDRNISVKIIREGFSEYNQNDIRVNGGLSINSVLTQLQKVITNELDTNNSIKTNMMKNLPGELLWKKSALFDFIDKEVLLINGKIYISDGNRLKIYSYDGELIKSIPVVDEKYSLTRPVICHSGSGYDKILLGSDSGGLFAYSASGDMIWKNNEAGREKFDAAPSSYANLIALPTIDKGIQIFDNSGNIVDAIALSKGEAVYSIPLFTKVNNMLVYGTEAGNAAAYDLRSKKMLWVKNVFADRIIHPIIGNEKTAIVLSRVEGKITALNPSDGSILWSQTFPELQKTALQPLFTGSKVILSISFQTNSLIIILDIANGNVIRKENFPDLLIQPYLAEENLITGSSSGKIYNYDLIKNNFVWQYSSDSPILFVAGDRDNVFGLSKDSIIKIKK